MKTDSTLLVMALESESQGLLKGLLPTLYTGVGKVNATLHLSHYLSHHPQIKRVINLGTAGSSLHAQGSLVVCSQFIQYDMDATAFGYEPYQTPNEPQIILKEEKSSWSFFRKEPEGVLHTADRFVVDLPQGIDAVDMEGFALCKTAKFFKLPFISVKFISDGADESATKTWEESLKEASRKLSSLLHSFLEESI